MCQYEKVENRDNGKEEEDDNRKWDLSTLVLETLAILPEIQHETREMEDGNKETRPHANVCEGKEVVNDEAQYKAEGKLNEEARGGKEGGGKN